MDHPISPDGGFCLCRMRNAKKGSVPVRFGVAATHCEKREKRQKEERRESASFSPHVPQSIREKLNFARFESLENLSRRQPKSSEGNFRFFICGSLKIKCRQTGLNGRLQKSWPQGNSNGVVAENLYLLLKVAKN